MSYSNCLGVRMGRGAYLNLGLYTNIAIVQYNSWLMYNALNINNIFFVLIWLFYFFFLDNFLISFLNNMTKS